MVALRICFRIGESASVLFFTSFIIKGAVGYFILYTLRSKVLYNIDVKRISFDGNNGDYILSKAVSILRNGGLIVYPTETCYGLGVDMENDAAVDKLWLYKGDRGNKPVLALADSMEMVDKYLILSDLEKKIAQKYWPGPVTMVALSKNRVSKKAQGETDTLGMRISDNLLATSLVGAFGKPISSTSANISGGDNPFSVDQLLEQVPQDRLELIDLVIDVGLLEKKPSSTVIKVEGMKIVVLREGVVRVEI